MSATLFVYLDADWPRQATVCAWRLVDGRTVHDGTGAPGDWPPADRHVAVLSMDQVRHALAALPPGVRWNDAGPLAMAIEEQLAAPLEQQTVVPLRQEGGTTQCAVVQTERLKTLIACFGELKRPLARVECEADKLPPPEDGWRVYRAPHGAWLHDGRRGLALDEAEGGQPPLLLRLALAEGPPPAMLWVSGATPELAAVWGEALALPVRPAPPDDWRLHCATPGVNLLTGELAPRRDWTSAPRVRLAAGLLAFALVGQLGLDAAGWAAASWRIGQLREQQLAVLRGVTDAPASRRPGQDLRAVWAAARARVGEPGADEFLPMLSALARTLPTRPWRKVEFAEDRLSVDWQGNEEEAARAEARLAASGYESVSRPLAEGQVSTALRFGGEP